MTAKRLKVVFMGTPDFAVPCLEALYQHEQVELVSIVTQPDRPKGRGQKLAFSPVKAAALSHNLPVFQPERIKAPAALQHLQELAPDWIVVVAFGQILPPAILDLPVYGCCNVHASLLPQYRGAAPIHWAVLNGEPESGVTTMFMDVGMDTGDMILKQQVKISPDMTSGELHDRLMQQGAECLLKTLEYLLAGALPRTKQVEAEATYAPMLTRELEKVDWSQTAANLHNLIRGLNPWPGAYALRDGRIIKIWQTRVVESVSTGQAGQVVALTKDGFVLQTGQGRLEILQVQPQNKKRMTAAQYLCGHSLECGEIFE